MLHRSLITMALTAALVVGPAEAWAFDQSKYPDWSGAWRRIPVPGVTGQPGYDPTKRLGPPQVEIVITSDTVHVLLEHVHDSRRIFTDGRDWPTKITPTLQGYSIGKWIDTDGDGRFDVLEVETRAFRGPRAFDATGMPLHSDNQTIVRERIYTDKSNPNILVNEITTIDSSLTRPWTVTKRAGRNPKETQPDWHEENCAEGNRHVEIGGQGYFLSGDDHLMPAQKGQQQPDLRYFDQAQN
jgi:hypothetical protein